MPPKAIMLNDMLNTLEDKDYDTIIDYIRLLSATRKKRTRYANNSCYE